MNKSILALVFLMAGTLLTTTVVTTVPAAYAGGDDHDDDNGDGNKNKAEDESAAAIADCDDNEVDFSDYDCFGIAVNDIEIEEEDDIINEPGDTVICHVSASGQEQTLELSENAAAQHLAQHDGFPGAGPDREGPCEV
jgi:hypothetical protein